MAAPAALKGAFDAKIGKVPVVAIGIPLVIVAVVASRMFGKKTTDSSSADGTSQPTFFAKDVPDTWAAVDTQTGIAHSPDGTITYVPTNPNGTPPADSAPVTPVTPNPGIRITPKPDIRVPQPSPAPIPTPVFPPINTDPAHVAHIQHLQTLANLGQASDSQLHELHVSHEQTLANTPKKK